jgi:hypothetical protein
LHKSDCIRQCTQRCWNKEHQVRAAATVTECIWRRIVGATLVLALVFQGLVFASVSGALAGSSAKDLSWPGFEVCRHDAANAPDPADELPAGYSDCTRYCIFYRTPGTNMLAAPEVSAILLSLTAAAEQVQWLLAEWYFPSRFGCDSNFRPRGPPPRA